MGASDFAVQLDLAGSGLIQTIEDQLLQCDKETTRIRAEPVKLSVYGSPFSPCLTRYAFNLASLI